MPVFGIVMDGSVLTRENNMTVDKRAIQDRRDMRVNFFFVCFLAALPLSLCSRLSVLHVLDFICLANHCHNRLGSM